MSDAGNGDAIVDVTLTFDDEAASMLPDGAQIVSGTFQPSNFAGTEDLPAPAPPTAGSALSVFDGSNSGGTWNLFVDDDFLLDVGSIASWSLDIQLGGAVTIDAGGDAADGTPDTFTVETVGDNTRVTVNAVEVFNEPSAGITSLLIQGSTDVNTVNIQSTAAAYTTTVEGAGAIDTVHVGDATNSIQGILGNVLISNNPASTNINLNNQGDATGRTVTIADGSVAGLAPASIDWDSTELNTLMVNAGTGGDTLNVTSTDATDPYIVNGGGGADIFNITGPGLGSQLDANGQDGSDTFNITGIPATSGLNIDGGDETPDTDGDVIHMNAYGIDTVRHFLDTPSAGRFEYDGDNTDDGGAAEVEVDYVGLEPIVNNGAVVNRVFSFGAGADTDVAILDDPTAGNNITRIQAPANAEMVNFTTPTGSLTVNLGAGADVISVDAFDSSYNTPVTNINGDGSPDELRIGVVPAGLTMNVDSGDGTPDDRTVVGQVAGTTAVTFAQFNTGVATLAGILGTLNIDDFGGVGETYLDDSAAVAAETYTVNALAVVPTFGGPGLTVDLASTAGTINVTDNMDFFQLAAGTGADMINVNATTDNGGTTTATFFGNAGNDTFNIAASALAANNNVFFGDANDDTFEVNLTTAAAISAPITIHGGANDFGGGVGSRDVVNVNENFGLGVVPLAIAYTGNVGDSEVTVDGLTSRLTVDTVETINYDGAGNDDTVTVTGTPAGTDLISVAPISANRGLVFNNDVGDASGPFDGPPQVWADRIPGVSGGSVRPDLDLSSLSINGLTVADTTAGADDRLYIYGESTAGLNDGNAFDPFGFGAGQILPAVAEPTSFNTIVVTDTLTTVDGLLRVNYNNTDFVQAVPDVTAAVVINAGFEGNPPATAATDIADDITLNLSANYKFQVNGGDPDPATTAIVPPDGDRLNIPTFVPVINVFSNKNPAGAPVVTIEFPGSGFQPFSFSSIENFGTFNAATVNLIGDNNDTTVDQTDNFIVVGGDTDSTMVGGDADGANEFTLVINGSIPIPFAAVQFLNAFGFDQQPISGGADNPATPAISDDIDTLEITPWASYSSTPPLGGQAPSNWGVNSFFNEGSPTQADGNQQDLFIYHTSIGGGGGGSVSEDIVIQPSGPDNGELRVTNAVNGSLIFVQQLLGNTDIIVMDDDGSATDTDTLTLRGTNPDTPQVSGNDTFLVNFDAAGTIADPLVTVSDANTGNILYRLRSFSDSGIQTLNTLVGGAGYVNGVYANVPLTGGSGSLATANITVAGGAVTNVVVTNSGSGYTVGDVLSANNANLGGAGAGFSINVASLAFGPIASVNFDMLAGNDSMTFFAPTIGNTPAGVFTSGVNQVQVQGGAGDDSVNVDFTASDPWTGGRLTYDGGAGSDSLTFADGASPQVPLTTANYTPGPDPGEGRMEHTRVGVAGTGIVNFTNLEPTFDFTAAATVIVNADNADNAISYFTDRGVGTLGNLNAGAGYANGVYLNVPLTGGTGSGARADITVVGGAVTTVTLVNDGQGYTPLDTLSASATDLGGGAPGTIFDITVTGHSATVSVDNQEVLVFANKANLVINAQAGSDEISLNYQDPTGITSARPG